MVEEYAAPADWPDGLLQWLTVPWNDTDSDHGPPRTLQGLLGMWRFWAERYAEAAALGDVLLQNDALKSRKKLSMYLRCFSLEDLGDSWVRAWDSQMSPRMTLAVRRALGQTPTCKDARHATSLARMRLYGALIASRGEVATAEEEGVDFLAFAENKATRVEALGKAFFRNNAIVQPIFHRCRALEADDPSRRPPWALQVAVAEASVLTEAMECIATDAGELAFFVWPGVDRWGQYISHRWGGPITRAILPVVPPPLGLFDGPTESNEEPEIEEPMDVNEDEEDDGDVSSVVPVTHTPSDTAEEDSPSDTANSMLAQASDVGE